MFVAYLLGTLVASLPTGMLIDRIGRRWILLTGPLVVAISSLLIAKAVFSGSFPELLAYRFIAGVGTQMWMQSRITVIADTGSSQQRGKQVTQMFGVQQIGRAQRPAGGRVRGGHLGIVVTVPYPRRCHPPLDPADLLRRQGDSHCSEAGSRGRYAGTPLGAHAQETDSHRLLYPVPHERHQGRGLRGRA